MLNKTIYDTIILDYFFSPAGWVNSRWTVKFFSETLPAFVEEKLLKSGGTIWLPHLKYVSEMLDENCSILSQFYDWEVVEHVMDHPLYQATELVQEDLFRCPDMLVNETQIQHLDPTSPFILLKARERVD